MPSAAGLMALVMLVGVSAADSAAGVPGGRKPPKTTTTTTVPTTTAPTTSTSTSTSTTTTSTSTTTTTTTLPGTGVYKVPASIPSDCSRPVEAEISAWIASVPDYSVVEFTPSACYALDQTITVSDRLGLTIDGKGATFKAVTVGTSNRDNWRFNAGGRFAIRNMVIRGAHPHAGVHDDAYNWNLEWQHGIRLAGVQGAIIENIEVYDVYGDFVEPMWDNRLLDEATWTPSRNITVRNSRFERNGRMGFGLTHVDGFVLENSYVGDVNWSIANSELDFETAMSRNIRIANNTFGKVRHSVYVNAGGTANAGGVVLHNNTMLGPLVSCRPPVYVETPESQYRSGYTISENRFIAYGDAFDFDGVRQITVSRNTVNFVNGGCGTLAGVGLIDSHDVSVTENAFIGAETAVKQDAISTNVSQSGNTL